MSRFDFSVCTMAEVILLARVEAGEITTMNTAMMGLLRRKLITPVGFYGNKGITITTRGRYAARLLFRGQRVRFMPSYQLPDLRGRLGTIETILDAQVDGDGIDEHGYDVIRARPMTSAAVRVDGLTGQFMVYRPCDLEAVFATDQPRAGYFPGRDPEHDVLQRKVAML